ncbi:MAG: hypothetical protein ACRDP3_14160 [Streptomyces sp.]|uniref:hypothetical protein n=1 Tax=Streptomyces sp. TaxID=1931 RepID=UPI003D6B8E91
MTRRVRYGRSRIPLRCAPLLVLALLAGCGGGADGAAGDGSDKGGVQTSSQASQTSQASQASLASSPWDSGSPAPRQLTALPQAADGKDTGSCADGNCEVELAAGDELFPSTAYGVQRFTVESIKDRMISWRAVIKGGSSMRTSASEVSRMSCAGGECHGLLGRTTGELTMNDLTVSFTAIVEDRAIAQVTSGT